MKLALFQVFIILFVAASTASPSEEKDSLVLLHVLFRHGNRTPDKGAVFPNSLNVNNTYEPLGFGQLTTKGKETEYKIGKYIRKAYGHLIPEQYVPNVVESLSTNFKRTKMSLELVLTGLFRPLPSDVFADDLVDWQPIPFDIEDGVGALGVAGTYCANYISSYYKYILSEEAQEIIAGYSGLYEELSRLAGKDIIVPVDVASIYMTLKCEEDYGLKLPDWASEYYPRIVEEAGAVDYEFSTATSQLKRLSAGFLLKKILEDSEAKRNGTLGDTTKVFLYSAHEWNVATMLRTLNVFERHVPPFGATIFFEIHDLGEDYGLKVLYQDYTEGSPRLMIIPGCTSICSFKKVYELLGESLPGENDICSMHDEVF